MPKPGSSEATRLYLDCAATTPLAPEVLRAMASCSGVPSPPGALKSAREEIAQHLGASPNRLRLVTGGTVANNYAIRGLARAAGRRGRLISQPTEHPSVLAPLRELEASGFELEWLPVDRDGVFAVESLRVALARGDACLVSIMYANHETGVRQPIPRLSKLCQAAGVPLHVDAVQGLRTEPLTLDSTGADVLTFSAHKLNGPKGIGALVASERAPTLDTAPPLPVALALGLAEALRQPRPECGALQTSRDALQSMLLARLTDVVINGAEADRLASHLSVSFGGLSGEALTLALDQEGIAVSAGAACASGDPSPSSVILALGRSRELATGTIRFSLERPLASEELSRIAEATHGAVERLRRLA